jgi:putative addiction module killer protein
MFKLIKSDAFIDWFDRLRDIRARDRIIARLLRLQLGNLGDVKAVGDGVSELRIDYGPGYRIYVKQRGSDLILLLIGGDKSTQVRDIKRAKEIAATYPEKAEKGLN